MSEIKGPVMAAASDDPGWWIVEDYRGNLVAHVETEDIANEIAAALNAAPLLKEAVHALRLWDAKARQVLDGANLGAHHIAMLEQARLEGDAVLAKAASEAGEG